MRKFMKRFAALGLLGVILLPLHGLWAQKNYNAPPMFIDVNAIKLDMKKINGEGGLQTQYSWMLTGATPEKTEIFFWPSDQWMSSMLYQIFNPICLDDSGRVDQHGQRLIIPTPFINTGKSDFTWEIRRYRPPYVTVDGIPQTPAYRWEVDPKLKPDMAAVFEDVLPWWGIRSHVEIYAFSNPNHQDYIIWKATHKFTGETKRPIENPRPEDFFPDQTVRLWWPISFSFGPSKAGEREVLGFFAYEGEDDLDSWFKRKSQLVPNAPRDTLYIAYYWDSKYQGIRPYPNGSVDDTGDPDRITGHLLSPQIPGFTLLYADKSAAEPVDDPLQPYSMPHAGIVKDLWGRRDFGLRDTYIGHDSRGRFPKDAITEGWATRPEKGPMRFITVGPYELTKNAAQARYDSFTVVYAIGVGSLSWEMADSIGKAWFRGEITDQQKNEWVLSGRDSLFKTLDRAYWAWSRGLDIPDPPPPPDLEVNSGPDEIRVHWSYPDASYFKDPDTGVEDWYAWRVYRKKGAARVNDPNDNYSGERWQLVYETTNRSETTYIDRDVTRGVSYYYAVTAIDDGTQNTNGLFPGQKLESSRFANRTGLPASPFKAGLAVSDQVRVVPNPATIAAGGLGFPGEPDKIVFVNLPYKCTLTIFTETGDEVKRIQHEGTADEKWDQRTDNNQYVMSGIYILAVTDAEDVNGKALPKQFVKFVLIR